MDACDARAFVAPRESLDWVAASTLPSLDLAARTLARSLDEWLERASAAPAVQRIGITPRIAREVVSLSAARKWDPADRILVATARVLGARLVTRDFRIIESELVSTI